MPSLRSRLFSGLLKVVIPKGKTHLKPIEQQRLEMEKQMARIQLPEGVRSKTAMVPLGPPSEWLIPAKVHGNRQLFYLHGGGYFKCSIATHRAFVGRLAQAMSARALHIDYRLAPEHPYPAGVNDCLAAYQWLLTQEGVSPQSLVIGGESAGGNLVMATLLAAREKGLPLPAAALCFSPHVDFTFTGKSITTCAKSERLYTLEELIWMRQLYLGDKAGDPTNWREPLISPIYADLAGLPPLLIHAAATEMLRDDAVRLAECARQAGVITELTIWDGLFHAFQMVDWIPESRQALQTAVTFVERHTRKSPQQKNR